MFLKFSSTITNAALSLTVCEFAPLKFSALSPIR